MIFLSNKKDNWIFCFSWEKNYSGAHSLIYLISSLDYHSPSKNKFKNYKVLRPFLFSDFRNNWEFWGKYQSTRCQDRLTGYGSQHVGLGKPTSKTSGFPSSSTSELLQAQFSCGSINISSHLGLLIDSLPTSCPSSCGCHTSHLLIS